MMGESHNGSMSTSSPTRMVRNATQSKVVESVDSSRYVPVRIVLAAFAWKNTPGRRDDLLVGASRTSPESGSVAPMNTILPATCFGSNVPLSTLSAEISFAASESFSEKLRTIDACEPVGMNRPAAMTPPGRPIGGAGLFRNCATAAKDNAGRKMPCSVSKKSETLRTTPSEGSWFTCTWPIPAATFREGRIDACAIERERRLAVASPGAPSSLPPRTPRCRRAARHRRTPGRPRHRRTLARRRCRRR